MSLYAIADLHLSLSTNKPMNIFPGWDDHVERLKKNWQETVSPDDVVVVPGDISWAISLDEAKADFDFINRLNGHKVILKGNHDYWWNSMAKMNRFLEENGFACSNVALGVGSFSFQCIEEDGILKPFTRDTFSSCIKATYCEIDDVPMPIFKNPKDGGFKKSQKGCCVVVDSGSNGRAEHQQICALLHSLRQKRN